jgi:bifunctional non-homologous end joining protein LigD
MQATTANVLPTGNDWIFELKYDGFRCLAIRESGRLRLLSRQGRDMAACFPEIVLDFRGLPGDLALDGELVVLDHRGVPQFERLARRALTSRPIAAMDAAKRDPAVLFVFDVLFCRGQDQRRTPLFRRKRTLQQLLTGTERVKYVQHIDVGADLYAFAETMELEGVMGKRASGLYVSGRSKDWLKFKTPIGRERERARFDRERL